MINQLERFGFGLILGPIPPLLGLLSFWWGAYALLPENWVATCALSGLLLGLLADGVLLRRWTSRASQLGFKFWIALYLFYSMGAFGFFMGVPVFNIFLAIPAGFVVAIKMAAESASQQQFQSRTRLAAWFTTGVMAAICFASAALAFSDPYTSANLEGMLGLSFKVTAEMLGALVVIGGAALLAGNWWLTTATIRFSNRVLHQKMA